MVACGGPSWGPIMPAPLAQPKRLTVLAVDFEGGVGDFELGVGGEDGGGEGVRRGRGVSPRAAAACGDGGDELFDGERDADDAGGGREDLVEDAAELVGDGDAGFDGRLRCRARRWRSWRCRR